MKEETRVIKTFKSNKETEMVQETKDKADLQKKIADRLEGIDYTFDKMYIEADKATGFISLSRSGDRGATVNLAASMVTLKLINKKNGQFVEDQAILAKDPALVKDSGYSFYKPKETPASKGTHAENTEIEGTLFVSTDHVEKARCYKVEGMIKGTVIPIKFDPIVIYSGQNVDGFISGELYLIRTCAVNAKGEDSEWSDYFEIRVK